ncbi:GspH/FimT family pseudopilin [Piscinibacter koreensis]|uniref:Type II secretion system protein H n=1 Tax=Piscinibacter koreensis TaxID=2742824 RepID=A0A7Y6NQ08_9BURK|nr:GspH/FimT family pseudopilin [Schlegelella koreensis]NUZ07223.1 GspH/FimT family pseudopilin [Schlegelella koreensis]
MAHANAIRPAGARRAARGFTLIEAAIVLAVAMVIAFAVAPTFQEMIDTRRLVGAADQLASDLQHVRSAAVARNQTLRVSFHTSAAFSCYVVHTGGIDDCTCAATGAAVCNADVRALKTIALPAGRIGIAANVASIAFDPVHGTSTPTGTLRVTDARGRAIHHVVNIMGRVRSCTPLGAVAGYRAC